MTVVVHKDVTSKDHLVANVINLQAAIGGIPVSRYIDGQHLAAKIIEMQKRLNVLGKFATNLINTAIDDQHLAAKLIAVEVASNLP